MVITKVVLDKGQIRDLKVVLAQVQMVKSALHYVPDCLEPGALDIVPKPASVEIAAGIYETAVRDLKVAEQMLAAELVQVAANGPVTRSSAPHIEPPSVVQLRARVAAQVVVYESKSDRLQALVKAADARFDKEMAEVKELVRQFSEAFPVDVLERLLPGARSVGMQASVDGSVVSPGLIFQALQLVESGARVVTIPDSLTRYGKVLNPLKNIFSADAEKLWGQMLTGLRGIARDLSGQVGALSAYIVGRWIVDLVSEAMGTLGGGPGTSLEDLLVAVIGDGKDSMSSLDFNALFDVLSSPPVRAKVSWIAQLPSHGNGGVTPTGVAKVAAVPSTGGSGIGTRGVCFAFQKHGACSRGDTCPYSHVKENA